LGSISLISGKENNGRRIPVYAKTRGKMLGGKKGVSTEGLEFFGKKEKSLNTTKEGGFPYIYVGRK